MATRPCKWKYGIKGRDAEGNVKDVKFPCRFPNEELTSELCTQCLLGDLFGMFYAQTMSLKQGQSMQEEIMAFLKNFTSDDFDNLR